MFCSLKLLEKMFYCLLSGLFVAKIVVIVGSVRSERNGIKVTDWIAKYLKERNHTVSILDPLKLNLPLLDKMYKELDNPPENLKNMHKTISEAEGYVPVTPEYNHSTSSALKNTLDYFLEEYFFKPSAIVSYSVGPFAGILAGAHLRQVLAEMGAPSIPSSLAISKVGDVFDSDGNLLDSNYERRAKKFVDEFEWYIEAFSNQRKKGTPY